MTDKVREKINKAITEWMFRMRDLGGLKDFLNKKSGFWVFECPEVTELMSFSLQQAREEERERIFEAIRENTYYPPMTAEGIISLIRSILTTKEVK